MSAVESVKPLFPFYGSKWRDARRYPPPHNGVVVEPFAGAAGYSLWYMPERVFLYDVDPIIVGVWHYLINVSAREILALPDLEVGESVDSLSIPQEARWLIGFWLNRGSAQPKKTKTAYSARTERSQLIWSARARERIASQVHRVNNWSVLQRSYEDVPLRDATWFIDPPYVNKGKYYRFRDVNYSHLATWVRERGGQVIVCEQADAEWLPFAPLASIKSSRGRSEEVVWLSGASEREQTIPEEASA
jgi:site-specific DNA-adenine methylase